MAVGVQRSPSSSRVAQCYVGLAHWAMKGRSSWILGTRVRACSYYTFVQRLHGRRRFSGDEESAWHAVVTQLGCRFRRRRLSIRPLALYSSGKLWGDIGDSFGWKAVLMYLRVYIHRRLPASSCSFCCSSQVLGCKPRRCGDRSRSVDSHMFVVLLHRRGSSVSMLLPDRYAGFAERVHRSRW